MSASDPTYHQGFHYECNLKVLKEIENLKLVKILAIKGTQIMYQFNSAFFDVLGKEMENARNHVVPDETVDEDFVVFHAVIIAVNNYLPKRTPKSKLLLCCEMVFNTLMAQQYGTPLLPCKKFGFKVDEFAKEIYSLPISEELANEMKQFKKVNWKL